MCNICCEEFTSKKVVLACNPKHIFCYECIFDWYKKKSGITTGSSYSHSHSSGSEDRTCPICRKDGGFLTIPPEISCKNQLPGIHVEKAIVYKQSYSGACDCINYNNYNVKFPCSSSVNYSIVCFDGEYKAKRINVCWSHFKIAQKGGQLCLQDGSGSAEKPLYNVFQRVPCQIKMGSGSQCTGNCNVAKNGSLQSITVGNYGEAYVCNKHKIDYEKGKVLALFGASADHPLRSFSKTTSTSTSSSTSISGPTNIPEGTCGEKLKNGGYCKRIGKAIYGGKCAAHKPSSSLSLPLTTGSNPVSVPVVNAPKIDINKFVNTWNMLHTTLTTLKATVDKAEFDNGIKKLEESLSRIHQHISSLKYNAYEENSIVCEEIEAECTLFCQLLDSYKKEPGDHQPVAKVHPVEVPLIPAEPPVKSEATFCSPVERAKNVGSRKSRYVLIDLFNLKSSSYCNVRMENGKLCSMPGNKYSNMKCSRHHQNHYNKEFFHSKETDLFVQDLSPEELKKILDKPGK